MEDPVDVEEAAGDVQELTEERREMLRLAIAGFAGRSRHMNDDRSALELLRAVIDHFPEDEVLGRMLQAARARQNR